MSNTPSDAEIEALAQQHLKAFAQFRLGEVWFEGEVEFARAVLAKWGTPQPSPAGPPAPRVEPVAWLNPWRADQVTTDYDAYGRRGIPLYTAPQPAPAPLSDDTQRLDWLDQNIFSREMSEWDAKYGHGPDYNMWVVFSPKGVRGSARDIIDAAIDAQGGK